MNNFFEFLLKHCDGRFKYIVMIVGNHENMPDAIVKTRFTAYFGNINSTTSYHLLLDDVLIVRDDENNPSAKLFGSRFKASWSIPSKREFIKKNKFDEIPKDIDILLTHFPCNKNNLDIIYNGESRGSEELTKLLDSDYFTKLKIHLLGHNHDARGYHYEKTSDRLYVNASSMVGHKKEQKIVQPFTFDF